MTEPDSRTSPIAERALRLARWMDRTLLKRSPRVERILMAVAGAMFVAAAVIGFLTLPEGTRLARWELLLLVALIGPPGRLLFLALEYRVGAHALGLGVSLGESLRISVYSSAANLLPLPGSVLVRTMGLRQAGSSYRRAVGILLAVGLIWVGTAAVVAGTLLWARAPVLAAILAPAGLGLLVVGHLLVRTFSRSARSAGLTARIVAVEVGSTLLGATRIYLTVLALGIPIAFPQAAGLQVARAVATASGIFPGALGLREALTGAMSPVVGLAASVGLVSSTIGRILDKAALLPIALFISLRAKRGKIAPGDVQPALTGADEALETPSSTER